ncbi:MAG: c-type cytochrome [Thermodesulfobacteriota bacterium]
MRRLWTMIMAAIFISLISFSVEAASDGKGIYLKYCASCHGIEGKGNGPASEFLLPRPRNLTDGVYKWRTTSFDDYYPSEEDIFNTIKNGLAGTSMPGWADVLNDNDIRSLVKYLKDLAGLENPEKGKINIPSSFPSGTESIENGKALFKERCVECHGKQGRGDSLKRLKDDWGFLTVPRDFSKQWTFRAGSSPKDVYARIGIGIPGTQMPSYDDPENKKRLSDEEKIDVANYVSSLARPDIRPTGDNVVRAKRVKGPLPEAFNNTLWEKSPYANFYVFPQFFSGERLFTPTLDSISVRALYNEKEIAFLLEWHDPVKSVPGDKRSKELSGEEPFEDSIALEFPVEARSWFGMGDEAKGVIIWQWKSGGVNALQKTRVIGYKGPSKAIEKEPIVKAFGEYEDGAWRVIMKSPLKADSIEFKAGEFMPIAFAAWDGSNAERGARHVMTGWNWVSLEEDAGWKKVFFPLAIFIFILVFEIIVMRGVRKG